MEETVFSREGSILTIAGMQAEIPSDTTALSLLFNNKFISGGKYENDGYIYVDNKPVRKWFKNVENVKVWFPILEDLTYSRD
jgi:hypothetical protein